MAADITIDPVTVEVLSNTLTDSGIVLAVVQTPIIDTTGGTGGGDGGTGGGGGSTRPTSGMLYPRGNA